MEREKNVFKDFVQQDFYFGVQSCADFLMLYTQESIKFYGAAILYIIVYLILSPRVIKITLLHNFYNLCQTALNRYQASHLMVLPVCLLVCPSSSNMNL